MLPNCCAAAKICTIEHLYFLSTVYDKLIDYSILDFRFCWNFCIFCKWLFFGFHVGNLKFHINFLLEIFCVTDYFFLWRVSFWKLPAFYSFFGVNCFFFIDVFPIFYRYPFSLLQYYDIKGTISPDYICSEVIRLNRLQLGHQMLDLYFTLIILEFLQALEDLKQPTENTDRSLFYWVVTCVALATLKLPLADL